MKHGLQNFRGLAPHLAVAAAMLSLAAAVGFSSVSVRAGEQARQLPAAAIDEAVPAGTTSETAIFAGGCFWGVQGVFQHVRGVSSVVSGYAGGSASTAKYEVVGSGLTGHAESVRITYDPRQISYGGLLQIFFSVAHDPTEKNRQGPDLGSQYRSTVFPTTADQERVARSYIAQLDQAKIFGKPLATTVEPMKAFYPAEAYHQNFLVQHPTHPYIVANDLPKVDDLKHFFPSRYAAEATLVR